MAVRGGGREADDEFLSPHIPDSLVAGAELGAFMRTVVVNVESQAQDFPVGAPDGGNWRITVSGPVLEIQDVTTPSASFVLPAGGYLASAVRLDVSGTPIGPVATAEFVVVDLFKQINVAKTVTVVFP